MRDDPAKPPARRSDLPNLRKWVAVAAGVEVVTGLVLVIRPSLFVRLLFGAALPPQGQALGRLAGFSLLASALACWPGRGAASRSVLRALLVFSLLTTIDLVYLGGWQCAGGTATLAGSWLARGPHDYPHPRLAQQGRISTVTRRRHDCRLIGAALLFMTGSALAQAPTTTATTAPPPARTAHRFAMRLSS